SMQSPAPSSCCCAPPPVSSAPNCQAPTTASTPHAMTCAPPAPPACPASTPPSSPPASASSPAPPADPAPFARVLARWFTAGQGPPYASPTVTGRGRGASLGSEAPDAGEGERVALVGEVGAEVDLEAAEGHAQADGVVHLA